MALPAAGVLADTDLRSVSAVWNRRPHRTSIPERVIDPDDRRFAEREWLDAVHGALQVLDAPMVNDLDAATAATKPLQLQAAREAGLAIPPTLITNDPVEVRSFVKRYDGNVIHKAITAPKHVFVDTRMWVPEEEALLDSIVCAPVIFQQRVDGPANIRATVIGDRVLAARFETAAVGSRIDSRLDLDVPCAACDIQPPTSDRLLRLMRSLGLRYGAVDFKINEDGVAVFLEVNPFGQFLFVEILTKLPISALLASYLVDVSLGKSPNA